MESAFRRPTNAESIEVLSPLPTVGSIPSPVGSSSTQGSAVHSIVGSASLLWTSELSILTSTSSKLKLQLLTESMNRFSSRFITQSTHRICVLRRNEKQLTSLG